MTTLPEVELLICEYTPWQTKCADDLNPNLEIQQKILDLIRNVRVNPLATVVLAAAELELSIRRAKLEALRKRFGTKPLSARLTIIRHKKRKAEKTIEAKRAKIKKLEEEEKGVLAGTATSVQMLYSDEDNSDDD